MNRQDAVAVAKDHLLEAGAKTPVVCWGHEPAGVAMCGHQGYMRFCAEEERHRLRPGISLGEFTQMLSLICKHCKCLYVEEIPK